MSKKITSILMIDDDRDDFDLFEEAVHEIDPHISVSFLERCEDGSQYRETFFDLVLLDINMPFHDGFSWLKGIRDSGYKQPIVMYTNSSNPAHISRAYQEGATLYFPKPESYQYLLRSISRLLELDWADPTSIRKMYAQNGKYGTFQVA